MRKRTRKVCCLVVASLLIVAVAILWKRHHGRQADVLETVASQIRVGMSRAEAMAAFHTHVSDENVDAIYLRGDTGKGQEFWGMGSRAVTEKMPPATRIVSAEVEVISTDGHSELIVTFGPNGVVSGVRLHSDRTWQQLWYACQSIGR